MNTTELELKEGVFEVDGKEYEGALTQFAVSIVATR